MSPCFDRITLSLSGGACRFNLLPFLERSGGLGHAARALDDRCADLWQRLTRDSLAGSE